ncbi:hypothetical protein L1049_026045 [Liquidambar formosana]|uniref:Uncharacterized protein n=1 Tax=Liquidambar formosana TaxID=63359 RepID=A0AAP0R634_LIQFO
MTCFLYACKIKQDNHSFYHLGPTTGVAGKTMSGHPTSIIPAWTLVLGGITINNHTRSLDLVVGCSNLLKKVSSCHVCQQQLIFGLIQEFSEISPSILYSFVF